MSKRTIDMELEAADVAFVQNGDNGSVFIQTKTDDYIRIDSAIVDRVAECRSRRAA